MRRFLFALFAVLIMVQSAFAAVTGYCDHLREGEGAAHFGHHFHHHEAGEQDAGSQPLADADCGLCHLAAFHPLLALTDTAAAPAAADPPPFAESRFHSALLPTPERPPRPRLA